ADAPLPAFGVVIVFEMLLVTAGLWRAMAAARAPAPARLDPARILAGALLREAWPLMLTSLAVIVYMKIDEVMLRQMAGPAAVGVYAAAVRISELWYFVPVALASSVLPALLRTRERDAVHYRARLQQFFDLNAGLAYGSAIPLALASGWITRLAYGEAFAAAGPVLAVHIWASLFVFLGVARGQWLVNEGHTRFYFLATLAGAVTNIGLNLVLIPRQGALGAAWATLIAYGLAAWLTTFASGRTREIAWMQTRAILLPLLGWRYFFR
ncbi:MAG: polysaccharide biosynthesis C-terminal domain-containing protein, partial [Oleiharenicola lentus]